MVDKSPEAAKTRGEAEAAAKAKATEKQRALEAKHLADLERKFGKVGSAGGELFIGTDQYGDLILYQNIYGTGKEKNTLIGRNEVFFWVQPDGITFEIHNVSSFIKKLKTDNKGNLEGLRKQLFDKNFMSETDYTTKNETAFNNAIIKAARNYSLNEVQKYTVEGQTKFNPFSKWITGLGSVASGDKPDLPVRDINLMDRDVVEAIVKDVYSRTTDMAIDDAFLKQETDRYMDQIEKGVLTTTKVEGKEVIRRTTKPFTEAQVQAELPKRIDAERPGATAYKKSFDFLAFLDGMGAPVV